MFWWGCRLPVLGSAQFALILRRQHQDLLDIQECPRSSCDSSGLLLESELVQGHFGTSTGFPECVYIYIYVYILFYIYLYTGVFTFCQMWYISLFKTPCRIIALGVNKQHHSLIITVTIVMIYQYCCSGSKWSKGQHNSPVLRSYAFAGCVPILFLNHLCHGSSCHARGTVSNRTLERTPEKVKAHQGFVYVLCRPTTADGC